METYWMSLCFLLDVPDVWTHATNLCALLLSPLPVLSLSSSLSSRSHLSILLSLSHICRPNRPTHTHSSVMSPYNPCYTIWTGREWKWHIKNRFFISCQEEEWTHKQTWHVIWCQYSATYSSLWHPAPISYTEKHICHFLLTLEHKLCKRFGDRSITYCVCRAFWVSEKRTKHLLSFSLCYPCLAFGDCDALMLFCLSLCSLKSLTLSLGKMQWELLLLQHEGWPRNPSWRAVKQHYMDD